ncbi:ABC transporter [Myxococcota bacterium]|nr:ABC transporter [Myxococcota bacterium]
MSPTAWSWPGARWWRCDLHVHTPESYDYTKRGEVTFADWAAGVVASGVQVVAVTDHNTPNGIEPARTALGNRAALFPGVELTVYPGVHLLVLFDSTVGRDQVAALLTKCDLPVQGWGEKETRPQKSVEDAMREARQLGGLCILAHVDAENGVLKEIGPSGTLRDLLRLPDVSAIEVKHGDPDLLKYVDGTIPSYLPPTGRCTQIWSSDAHTPADIGSHSTWIKMTAPTLEGLRLALQDGALSVCNPTTAQDPNQHAALVLESITIENTRYIGRSAPFTLTLNPWLNAIIGGRGTGKSSILELARAALRRETELPAGLKTEWSELVKKYENRGRGILTDASKVSVVYRKDGARFRIQWDRAGTAPPIEVAQPDGTWSKSEGQVAERFPVRIYSQKQVYELTREPEALLRIVDEAPEVGFRAWKERWTAEETRFLSLRAKVREVAASLGDEPRVRGELEDVQRKLLVFEGAGHADLLQRWQRRRRQGRAVDEWSGGLDGLVNGLAAAAEAVELAPADGSVFDPADPADAAVTAAMARFGAEVDALRVEARALADRASALRNRWSAERAGSPWTQAVAAVDAAYARLIEDLQAAGGGDPSEYGRLVQQRQLLEQKLKGFEGTRLSLATMQTQAGESLARLRALRLELSAQRAQFLEAVLKDNQLVRIEVVPLGDPDSVVSGLRSLLGCEDTRFGSDIGEPGQAGTLVGDLVGKFRDEFEKAAPDKRLELQAAMLSRVDLLKTRLQGIRLGAVTANHKTFATFLQARPPEQMDRLDAWFPGDTLLVSFQPAGRRKGFQPITQGSPGQRSAALLAFLLSHGDEPILLDQPEDDLDNQLVYDLIVQQLRRIKSRRQVLVVTHNPNIVVNGDAEHVVALDVRGGQATQVCTGGLQEQDVRDEICRVMEGGAEAFRERYRRIAHGGVDVRLGS